MAKTFASSTVLTINSVSYQSQCSQADLKADAAVLKATNFSSGGWEENLGGLKKYQLVVKFVKDSDLSGLDAVMFAALGTTLPFTLTRVSGAVSASNPQYSGTILIVQWTPIMGAVGVLYEGSYTWDGSAALVRATS